MAARRGKKKARRRDTSIRLLNVLEAYTYANILSQGILNTSPWGFITGQQDLTETTTSISDSWNTGGNPGSTSTWSNPDSAVSLQDLAHEPGQALAIMTNSFGANMVDMAIQGIFVGATFKFGRRMLRRQINTVNRSIFKPLGMGVKL